MSAILEVAEGLRWTDPQLSVALAEHAARAAGADVGVRGAAERSAVLALGQSDRPAELVVRALPHLREAESDGRATDAAVLRCELARAAVRCGDPGAAEALLEPLAGGRVLPPTARADALVAWAAARAALRDVAGVDAEARQVEDVLAEAPADPRRVAVQRARAQARRVSADAAGPDAVLGVATAARGGDGGHEAALALADHVDVLAELGRPDEARAAGAPALATTPGATTSLALGRVRCALARWVHLPAGDLDTADRLAREAEADLAARGHEAQVAEAVEVLADVAARRGETDRALEEVRRAHRHATAAHDETTRARIALAVALAAPDDRLPASGTGHSAAADAAPEADLPSVILPAGPVADDGPDGSDDGRLRSDDGPARFDDLPAPSDGGFAPPEGEAESSDTSWMAASLAALDAAIAASARPRAPAEPAPVADEPPEPSQPAEPSADPDVPAEPRRRRSRYREDAEPDGLLAAALAARAGAAAEANGTSADDARGAAPDEDGAAGHEPADDAAATRSRRLARARARWETRDTWLSRRPDGAGRDDDERGGPSPDLGGDDLTSFRTGPSARDDAGGRSAWGDSSREPGDDLLAPRADDRAVDPDPGRNGHDGHDRHDRHDRHVNGHRDHDTHTPSGAAPDAVSGTPSPAPALPVLSAPPRPAGVDDEWAQELALTLVDLLSEYQDPGVPLGTTRSPGIPAAPPPAADRPPSVRPAAPSGPPARSDGRSSAPNGGVPAARGDGAEPRLADLLAEAMDVYHAAGSAAGPAEDRRARR
ncbi:hypothetical protein [Actinomycetospora chlora]|uniref:hypothetical protein n=1 Tax=Actinomycetospora chlora TaxID=663608 RepID=UPI0031EA0167